MLISGVSGDEAGDYNSSATKGLPRRIPNAIYDVLSKENGNGNYYYSPANDFVILYKNEDVDSKSTCGTEQLQLRNSCNQYVEKFVYNDEPDSEGSESNELYCNKDLLDLVLINKESLDFLNSPSLSQALYQLGDQGLLSSDISRKYNFKNQLNKVQTLKYAPNAFNNPIFASSLLDFICFEGTETNCNLYMESVIKYVKHTIDQLKRISNGDYLTDKAKEKWRQMENAQKHDVNENTTLVKSSNLPLQIKQNSDNRMITIDNVQSGDNVKCLSNILRNKIIIEIPREIYTQYTLLSKIYFFDPLLSNKTNLIDQLAKRNKKSKLIKVELNFSAVERQSIDDVKSSRNVKSIVTFQAKHISRNDNFATAIIPMPYSHLENYKPNNEAKIVEIQDSEHEIAENNDSSNVINTEIDSDSVIITESDLICTNKEYSNDCLKVFESNDSSSAFSSDILVTSDVPNDDDKCPFNYNLPVTLISSVQSVSMDCLPEESMEDLAQFPNTIRKKSPIKKVRVKSPYENKSYLLEEKKRKKLLEIREKREKKKMAMNENCRIRKHKFSKVPIMPQHSSSVTKLSITNKSFYNSIYGHTNAVDNMTKNKARKDRHIDLDDQLSQEKLNIELGGSSQETINKSCHLDDPVTEVMNTQQSECSSETHDLFCELQLTKANECKADMIAALDSDPTLCQDENVDRFHGLSTKASDRVGSKEVFNNVSFLKHQSKPVPLKELKENEFDLCNSKKLTKLEFKKSIDKIYSLMNKLDENERINKIKLESKNSIPTFTNHEHTISTAYCSDSGTSLKHRLTSSNHSNFSFEKQQNIEEKNVIDLHSNPLTIVVPRVINTKQQLRNEPDTLQKGKKKVTLNTFPQDPGNPLKAISELLHELENKRKKNYKSPSECNSHNKKPETTSDNHTSRPVSLMRRPRLEHSVNHVLQTDKNAKNVVHKDHKPLSGNERLKTLPRQLRNEEKRFDKYTTRKIGDIIDEVKEAKGEAVRGPSKFNSRLDTLAKPKKAYVQAHSEEYLNRRGKNLMTDRLQRLAGTVNHTKYHAKVGATGAKVTFQRTAEVADVPSPTVKPSLHLERSIQCRQPPANSSVKKLNQLSETVSYQERRRADLLEPINSKMITVQSYVNTCHERSVAVDCRDSSLQRSVSKTPVPLIPHDLDFGSVQSSPAEEESTVIGSKIHRMINNIINCRHVAVPTKSITTESEDNEDNTCKEFNELLLSHNQMKNKSPLVFLDDHAEIFDDKYLETAIEHIPNDQLEDDDITKSNNYCVKEPVVEMQILENSFHRQMLSTSFHKRLSIKKITLTPKPSIQNTLILQSGDDGSVLLKSQVSNYLNFDILDPSNGENVAVISAIAKTQLEPILSSLPLHIMTVGCTFPQFSSHKSENSSNADTLVSHNCNNNQPLNNKYTQEDCSEMNITRDCNQFENEKYASAGKNVHHAPCEKALSDVTESLKFPPTAEDKNKNKNLTNYAMKHLKADSYTVQTKCTSSLDVLVTLLNEIQNITECHISNTNNKTPELIDEILKINNIENESTQEVVSLTSLDKLRQLDSSQSVYSLYISNDECDAAGNSHSTNVISSFKNIVCSKKPNCNDKEIGVDFGHNKEFVDAFTNIPSILLPVVTHNSHVIDCLEEILKKPSSHMLLLSDHESSHSLSFTCKNKIVEILEDSPAFQITHEPNNLINGQTSAIFPISRTCKNKIVEILEDSPAFQITHEPNNLINGQTSAIFPISRTCKNKIVEILEDSPAFQITHEPNNLINGRTSAIVPISRSLDMTDLKIKSKIIISKTHIAKRMCVHDIDSDPLFKIKRDILVTVYSMLVLTVFAALSIPDVFYSTL